MFRRTAISGLFMAATGCAKAQPSVFAWLSANDLELYDEQQVRDSEVLSDAVKEQVMIKYYLPLVPYLPADRVTTSSNFHWFRMGEKIFFPSSPNERFDKKMIDRLRSKVTKMLEGNNFKIVGLTISQAGRDTRSNPYVYFVIGVVTGDASFERTLPDKSRPKRRRGKDESYIEWPKVY